MSTKIVLSNRGALKGKYGAAGLKQIQAHIKAMVAADKARGLQTRLIFLDDAKAMKAVGGQAVASASDFQGNKRAVDAVYQQHQPDYLLILGSIDVVPHQDLRNPLFAPSEDPDEQAWSDLPYACDAPYSREIAHFRGPTRVVGRLPDLSGGSTAAHLKQFLQYLALATAWRGRVRADYSKAFALSTVSWLTSTSLSMTNVFGQGAKVHTSPKSGPSHPAARLAPLMHFVNCHGGDVDPNFYGESQDKKQQPISLTSASVANRIGLGTVMAAECCYGAQLYDSVTLGLAQPIAQQYLQQGCYGYFGSSTIAYGPADSNGSADLVTQYFLQSVLEGNSTGYAALAARQRYVEQVSELDPVDLKTLAQFNLLGDPSIHPVMVAVPNAIAKIAAKAAQAGKASTRRAGAGPDPASQARAERRLKLQTKGRYLEDSKPIAAQQVKRKPSAQVQQALARIAQQAKLSAMPTYKAYAVQVPPQANARLGLNSKALAARATCYHVAVAHRPAARGQGMNKGMGKRVALVAKERDGQLVGYRIYEEK